MIHAAMELLCHREHAGYEDQHIRQGRKGSANSETKFRTTIRCERRSIDSEPIVRRQEAGVVRGGS